MSKSEDMNPRERFVLAANRRVNKALDDIRVVAKLASDRYEYEAEDVDRIIRILRGAVDDAEAQLQHRPRGKDEVVVIPK